MTHRFRLSTRRPAMRCAAFALLVLAGCGGPPARQRQSADVLIRGGTLYDGGGGEPRIGDVVIEGDRIVYVGDEGARRFDSERTIDAAGRIVAPGFIDPHTHPDTYIRSDDPLQRRNAPWLMQGVATVAIGVDGGGDPEVAKEHAWFKARGVGTNLASYVGFGRVRQAVLRQDARKPDAQELERMKRLVANAMCEGAFGFSSGLFYAPQSFASTDEVVAVAREAALRGGIYDTHQRDESSYGIGLIGSTREAIDIGRQAGMPVHFAHIKALGVDVHGKAQELVSLIEAANAEGLRVSADQYPWLASGSSLESSLLPRWSVDGGRVAMLERFDDAATLKRIRLEMIENLRRRGGADSLLLISQDTPWTGKTLAGIAAAWKLDPIEAALRIIRGDGKAAVARRTSSVASFNMKESDLELLMRQPWVMTSSDGSDGHPRQYASFPEKYAKYVRQERTLTTAQFIRASTGLTADTLGIKGRGYLRPGYFADVVVIDPERYAPKADYVNPKVLSEGVAYLWINGVAAVDNGAMTDSLAGRTLTHAPPAGSCP